MASESRITERKLELYPAVALAVDAFASYPLWEPDSTRVRPLPTDLAVPHGALRVAALEAGFFGSVEVNEEINKVLRAARELAELIEEGRGEGMPTETGEVIVGRFREGYGQAVRKLREACRGFVRQARVDLQVPGGLVPVLP